MLFGLRIANPCGQWRLALLPSIAFWGRPFSFLILVAASCAITGAGSSVLANGVKYADEVTSKLNPTGRTVTFPAPLNDETRALGEVLVQITADDAILVEKASLLVRLGTVAEESVHTAIAALPDQGGFIPIDAVAATGLGLRFDSGLQELKLELSPDQRPVGELSLGGLQRTRPSSVLTAPEWAAGYVNVYLGLDQVWSGGSRGSLYDDQPSGRVELDSAIRLGGTVFENRAAYEGDTDVTVCPIGAICTYGHVAGLKRQSSRLVYDLPEQEIRVTAGDAEPLVVPFQRAVDMLGVSVEKSARKLNPSENISATGSGSFRLDRAATVDVRINGASVQQLQLPPGNYNLRDLPLTMGANDVELAIQDNSGERRTLVFNTYSDPGLLAEGKSEWAVTTGVPSYLVDNQRTYATGDWMGSAYYRYGYSDVLTVETDVQADLDVAMAGAGFDLGTPFGMFGLDLAGSTGRWGSGVAADLSWSYVNFEGLTGTREESLLLSAEFRSTDFRTPGEYLLDASGIIYPEQEYWLRLAASYSMPLYADVTAAISGRYQFDNDDRQSLSTYRVVGDRYGADVTLSAPLTNAANASLVVGYSNELYLRDPQAAQELDPEFRVALRLTVRPGDTTNVNASYDTLGNQTTLSAYRSEGSGIGRWDTSLDAQSYGDDKTGSVVASTGYWSNRAELRLSHFADFDGLDVSSLDGNLSQQRTSLRVGTALAFAGDKVAVGAPVRGGAFAILTPHDSLGSSEVTAGTDDNIRAVADQWGNGLVPDLPAYAPATTPIDVEDLPLGYSLGSGTFDTVAPYKSGFVFQVGSANSVSVYGTLEQPDGGPLALITGMARPQGTTGSPVSVFTNAQGRFGAEGLGPGRWILEMAGEDGPLTYMIDVPDSTQGLIKVGTLKPVEGGAP